MLVMENKVKFYSRFEVPLEIYTEKPVEVYIDQFTFDPIPNNSLRIIILEEPLKDSLQDLVQEYSDLYDYVLTFREEILSTNPKSVYFRGADIWTRGYNPEPWNKRFAVSTVVGGKNDRRMQGYALRHNLWREQGEITVPKEFYLSDSYKWKEIDYNIPDNAKRILTGGKIKMFDCMFHIAIENTSIENYYSEKLLDCFDTMTVPIYYGCTNIGDYFNINGIVIVNNLDNIIRECNNLSPEKYKSMKAAIEDNHDRIKSIPPYFTQVKNKLIEILKPL